MSLMNRLTTSLTRDWALKLTSLALAILLWTTVRAESPRVWEAAIPVRVINNDPDWVVADAPVPNSVRVRFTGPLGELLRTASDLPDVVVRIDEVKDTTDLYELRANWVRMPSGTDNTRVTDFNPQAVRVSFDPLSTRLVPIVVGVTGTVPPGFELGGPLQIEPSVVRASGARRALQRLDSLRLTPIDLRDQRARDTVEMMIDTTGTGVIVSPRTVRVIVPVRPVLTDTTDTTRMRVPDTVVAPPDTGANRLPQRRDRE